MVTATSGRDAAQRVGGEAFDAVITDLQMPGMDGIELISHVRAADEHVPVIVMTAFGTVETAVDAMKRGAVDYLSKPFEPEALSAAVNRVLRHQALHAPSDSVPPPDPFEIIASSSSPMQEVLRWARKVAPTEATVLILGESGTGKELVARAVHNQSGRTGAFVPCTACIRSRKISHASSPRSRAPGPA